MQTYIKCISLIGLLLSFCHSIVLSQSITPEPKTATPVNVFSSDQISDEEWLRFVRRNGITDAGIHQKILVMQAELALTEAQADEMENFISKIETQELTERTLDHEETVEEMQVQPVTRNDRSIFGLKEKSKNLQTLTLKEVSTIRGILGPKDLDFLFWLFEEKVIYKAEWTAYFKNHNYDLNNLADNVVDKIEKSDQFVRFKKKKDANLSSEQISDRYFETRRNLIRERVYFENFLNRQLPRLQTEVLKYKQKKNEFYAKFVLLGGNLTSLK